METNHGFKLIREQALPETNSYARLFRHVKTGAELLSLENDDPAKVFGVSFRTIPSNSTGVAHILEHIVLAGSEKYPVKEPFIELYKGTLAYFLNALTFEDKTVYPLSSPNVQDFYNLIDVYLDAVFHPLLKESTFKQEGWHYALPQLDQDLKFQGVVFNEMKGQVSNPDYLLALETQQTLLPNTLYAHRSGGDPEAIPDLTYADFLAFYQAFYHPANARFFFYGDDPLDERLRVIDETIRSFEGSQPADKIGQQPPFEQPRKVMARYPSSDGGDSKSMFGVSWLLPVNDHPENALTVSLLAHILMATPASPLRKALTDSGLGEEVYGTGYGGDLQLFDFINQMTFTSGLKGVAMEAAEDVETIILSTLGELVAKGIDPKTLQASFNSVEFQLREANYGGLPRGIMYMFGALSTWNYDRDPLAPLTFETPLASIKEKLHRGTRVFETYIQQHLLDNPHRVSLHLLPDPDFQSASEKVEAHRLAAIRASLNELELNELLSATQELQKLQETPDRPEDLARLPILRSEDLDPQVSTLPLEVIKTEGAVILFHDLPTFGISYLDVGFDLHALAADQLPYVPLLGRALIEMGTQREDTVELTQRIGRETGGIESDAFSSAIRNAKGSQAYLFLQAKVMTDRAGELLSILDDLLLKPRLDNQKRFLQIALEEKTRMESALIPGGHRVVDGRLRAGFDEAGWVEEQLSGIDNLFFLRQLIPQIESNWAAVHRQLEEILALLLNRQGCVCNLTHDGENLADFRPQLEDFLRKLPGFNPHTIHWDAARFEGHQGYAIPAQVNYVGKGAQLYELGYQLDGSIHVILGYLQFTFLWEKVRVLGGAYGAFSSFDPLSGGFTYLSYRDPNLSKTLDAYDAVSQFLSGLQIEGRELTKAIISTIGRLEPYRLPDAQGFTSMARYLTGTGDEYRQTIRDQILSSTVKDFNKFGETMAQVARNGRIVILGSKEKLEEANAHQGGAWLDIQDLL
ncbi:MAG: peptidase M16 [Anaerolineales bacterium]|nr:MAG: peptidase M16 [Anaerolineales bacterium]